MDEHYQKVTIYLPVLLTLILGTALYSQNMSASAILDSMTAAMQPVSAKGKMEQEIISSKNVKRVFTFEYFSENNGENVLIRYLEPRKVKNNAFLIKNNGEDIWVYFPRTRRVRKLASHAKNQKAQGSDFSYEDFSGSENWKNDYKVNLGDSGERETYLLNFIRKEKADVSYNKQKIFVDKRTYYPHRIFYFEDDEHVKTLEFKEITEIQHYPTAQRMVMKNHAEGSQTEMRILNMEYNVEFEENFFSERNLKK
jgi:outer membrane lipoprotein-sorting protein